MKETLQCIKGLNGHDIQSQQISFTMRNTGVSIKCWFFKTNTVNGVYIDVDFFLTFTEIQLY